ncbi:FecR domain-containing protein [Duganella sp. HH101]|uniref:FecR family protein n=1 Tax=Duganella sp. HH101 TaxID=1781066 RepID=UPI000874D833|nr:FecR family protein [Duganella sp. HH101]OFA02573.1 FecR protein [Duganella sp. HH101]
MRNQFHTIVAATLLGLGMLASGAWAGEAGKVVFVTGQVSVAARPLVLDAAVQEGDELSTGADGYVYVKTVDQGFLVLRPNSKARIVAYHIDTQNPANTRVKLELLQGVARSISGVGVKQARQNFRFNTPVAAIGVRGTDFVVYTDQQTSRVTVMSGGVVVSGFAGACGPEGGGPCEGGVSRELFAGQAGLMLQVQRGQSTPQLLRSPVMSPADQGAPARPDEPVGKVGGSSLSSDVNLDAQKSSNVLNNSKQITQANVTPGGGTPVPPLVDQKPEVAVPPVVPVAPPVLPPVLVRGPEEVIWGRYEAIAGGTTNAAVQAKLNSGAYEIEMVLGPYQISRLKSSAFVAPREGTASFVLAGSDAVLQRAGGNWVQAAVESGTLDVDFATRTFKTNLSVVGDNMRVPISSAGNINRNGELVNPNAISDTRIKGYLGGANVEEAAYLFQYRSTIVNVNGATKWSR